MRRSTPAASPTPYGQHGRGRALQGRRSRDRGPDRRPGQRVVPEPGRRAEPYQGRQAEGPGHHGRCAHARTARRAHADRGRHQGHGGVFVARLRRAQGNPARGGAAIVQGPADRPARPEDRTDAARPGL
ncbi:hypothetical protein G6F22_020530 [Rhizopus arrhizus]|nr:hypothetical protein G6F22_020530 [Rhizopus arrhizus]